jgi:hypothetical protein
MSESFADSRPSLLAAAAAASAMSALVLSVAAAPTDPHEAAGVFPPWWSEAAALAAAARAGAVLGVGAVPFIVIVRDPGGHAPARLRAAGALVSLDARGLAGCRAKEA